MKSKLNFFQKVIFAFNIFFAACLLIAYILPFVPPKFSAFLSILNLGLPVFMLINLGFALYWILRLKLHFIVSMLLVLGGYSYVNKIFIFKDKSKEQVKSSLKVMSYNVRLFNEYDWIDIDNVGQKISDFIAEESPDVVAFQDYKRTDGLDMNAFPYSFEKFKTKSSKIGIAIYSKYRILNKGSIDFPNTHNNAIYADILIHNDTLRIYAAHLESLKVIPDVKQLQKENHQKLISRVGKSFMKQQEQARMLAENFEDTDLPKIVCIDMNNTPFSYVANQLLSHNLEDAFIESGQGLGKTFDFDFLPLRIDAILNEKSIENIDFKNYDIRLSDHYPIMASFKLSD
ncbi:endonuclease/exonuclease/phosphatase family protein [Psychroflexus sediminis]|uniref:Metal-dependent hydrolase, endonuclease/exonuclease/phosphatase family n=1 Tax=Psychroflexus sediminis TaxID=470826 RepID=A0A1G7XGX8_9FLAO|nr:endonuclease/exonuclease/phosphatase family protein [Psychroflexus sediminis]SDG83384.1 Metal-dependent hydrolase, endonuclease/exonuclease/phosphatase family [Psychroflexus sediminis]